MTYVNPVTGMLSSHLFDRHLFVPAYTNIHLYQPDPDSLVGSVATVLLTDYTGHLTGYQQYRPDITCKKTNDSKLARYFTYVPRGTIGVWGLERFNPDKKDIYIVEGTFKAATLHCLGYNAIAVLTNKPKQHRHDLERLRLLGYNLIAIGDSDKAGEALVDYIDSINGAEVGFITSKDLDEYDWPDIVDILAHYQDRRRLDGY